MSASLAQDDTLITDDTPTNEEPAENPDPIRLDLLDLRRFEAAVPSPAFRHCLACGVCAGACPAAGIDGFDPRMFVQMMALGMESALVAARWPWICTMCGQCDAACPMEVPISTMVRAVRGLRDREAVPGILHRGIEQVEKTGNVLGLPKEDFIFIAEDVADEVAEEPGCEGFFAPIDAMGAEYFTTIHNKLINTHTEDLKHMWRIFQAAGASWTIPSDNWEGCNWGLFTGDDAAMRMIVGRILDQMAALEVKDLLWPE